MNAILLRLLLLAAIVIGPVPSGAQPPAVLREARVTLVAGKSPSKGGRTEVVRHAQQRPQNIVIVDRNASADDLAAALAMVNALRAQFGDSLSHDLRARPEQVRHGKRWEQSEYRKWLHEQLLRLRKAPDRELKPFGVVKAVQITLPPPSGTVTNPRGGN